MKKPLRGLILIFTLGGVLRFASSNLECGHIVDCKECITKTECIFIKTKSDYLCIWEENLLRVAARRTYKNAIQCDVLGRGKNTQVERESPIKENQTLSTPTILVNFQAPYSSTSEYIVPSASSVDFEKTRKTITETTLISSTDFLEEGMNNNIEKTEVFFPRVVSTLAPPPYSSTSVLIIPSMPDKLEIHLLNYSSMPLPLSTSSSSTDAPIAEPSLSFFPTASETIDIASTKTIEETSTRTIEEASTKTMDGASTKRIEDEQLASLQSGFANPNDWLADVVTTPENESSTTEFATDDFSNHANWGLFKFDVPKVPFGCPQNSIDKITLKVELALCRLAIVSKRYTSNNETWKNWSGLNAALLQMHKCEYLQFVRSCLRTSKLQGRTTGFTVSSGTEDAKQEFPNATLVVCMLLLYALR